MENREGKELTVPPSRGKVTNGVKPRRTIPDLFKETFIKKDMKDVTSYIVNDVAVPALKKTMVTMITNGAEMLFNGEVDGASSRSNGAVGDSKVDYGKPYRQSSSYSKYEDNRPPWETDRRRMRYVDVEVESREIAEDIRQAIFDDTVKYGMVPVRQLYEMTGLPWSSEDCDYGWSDISSCRIVPGRHGMWRIIMPTPEYLG